MSTATREQILALSQAGHGPREIGRRLEISHTHARRVVAASRPAGAVETLLADLERAGVRNYAIERERYQFRIINLALPLGARKETGCHGDLADAIREALKLWG